MIHPTVLALLRCPGADGHPCGGTYDVLPAASDGPTVAVDGLACRTCGRTVRTVGGIPVFHADAVRDYYDGAYRNRSRAQDLALGALSPERDHLARLVAEHGAQGPTLDVGCGTAIFGHLLPDFVGLDYSLNGLLHSDPDRFGLVCGSADRMPFAGGAFRTLFSFNALEHVPSVDRAFDEVDRVLAPGGLLVLKPAWHCTRFQTELVPIRPYAELNLRQKLVKAALPLLHTRAWKFAAHVPARLLRRLTAGRRPTRLRFRPLVPNFNQYIPDSDAAASIDCHEGILFFVSRGYAPLSHPTLVRQILAGHDWVLMRKPPVEAGV